MNIFLTVLFIIILLAILLGILYTYLYNKFNESIIRTNEAEARIDDNLREKYDLLNKCYSLAKAKADIDEKIINDILKLRAKKISNFELDRTLVKSYNDFQQIYEENKKLRDNDEIYKANKQIELIDEELITLRNYYNANILNYNRMVKKIPTNIVAIIKKYEEKPLYDLKDRNDNNYEDFKL